MFTSHRISEEMVTPHKNVSALRGGSECVDKTTIHHSANLVINVLEKYRKTKDLKIPHTQIQNVKISDLSEPLPCNIIIYIENFNNYIDSKKIYEIHSQYRGVFGGNSYNKFSNFDMTPLKKFRILEVRS